MNSSDNDGSEGGGYDGANGPVDGGGVVASGSRTDNGGG